MKKADIGIIGLAVMGENLILNMESRGFTVAAYNRTVSKVDSFVEGRAKGKNIIGTRSLEELAAVLAKPRKIMLMIKAGKPVDDFIEMLLPHLDDGDILIDGGNSFFGDTIRRTRYLEEKGLRYIGTGVSGGEEGALTGPSIMPGGSREAWPFVKPIFQAIAARVADGTPCCDWVGSDGAGHYVKMVHNGIEYGDMQMIAEAYFLMKNLLGMTPAEMHEVFKEWNKGELNSYLIEITRDIMATVDEETDKPMVDVILDTAGQKGTGKWTSQSALDMGTPAPTVAEAVFARFMSAVKEERVVASQILEGPVPVFEGDKEAFVEEIRQALYASKICSYAQGFQLLKMAADEYNWDLNYGGIALMWREGCIIRAQFLERIKEAFDEAPDLANLLLARYFRDAIDRSQAAWRRVVATAVQSGIPVPAFSSALAYYDGYRNARLPANVLQAQRDYFGAHTYERVDRPRGEFFHTNWTGRGGTTSATTYTA
ncbi:MAG TPA: decarboxylating NADP(+)-dependent phosphogluconate dehydrogenase [Anaerolineae bacterium]|nr:decarboxylating NADP(+)-dependent phosphogluconate dehydrogenase [Anaerolineae bacterium]